jgi:RND family efflux transporter MFP subunit
MKQTIKYTTIAVLAATAFGLALSGCDAGSTDDTAAPASQTQGGESVTIWADSVELFFEHPALVAGQEGEPWAIHLTDLRTFRAVEEGSLTLRFYGPSGSEQSVTQDAPARAGVYNHAPTFSEPGMYDLTMELSGSQVSDEIFVGPVLVYASVDEIPELPEEEAVGISFLKEQQWPIEFETVTAIRREIPRSILVSGRIIPVASGTALVSAPVDGLIHADANRSAPAPGQWVREGQRLAVLSPVGGDNAYAVQLASEQRLTRELARVERLHSAGAIPEKRLEETRRDLEVARAALAAMGAPADGAYELALMAPIAGVINERHLAAGQRVAAGDLLFSIVDPRAVWMRFNVPAMDAGRTSATSGATFSVEGSDRVYRTSKVVSVGNDIDPDRRTLSVIVEIDNADLSLKGGMLGDGRLLLGDPIGGIAVPNSAIRDEDGVFVAYVQIGGETFERRAVRVGPSDGEWTLVESGIRPGERVVTLGAYQVKLSSLNTSELSDHGHVH